MKIGDKIKVPGERNRYTIRAFSKRFIIMTKPFNPKHTYLYSVIDLERKVRGPDNLIFGHRLSYETDAEEILKEFESEETEVSHRRYKYLEPELLETIKNSYGKTKKVRQMQKT